MTTRPYTLRKRAERQDHTRQRIVDAALELHTTEGPAQTSIKAIAERAGVQRHTVYRHFPTLAELFDACSGTWERRNPFPDHEPWLEIADPRERLETALREVYAYYRATESDLTILHRDIGTVPEFTAKMAETDAALRGLAKLLARGWSARGRRRRLLLAAIGLALQFPTWQTLARHEGLDDDDAATLMTAAAAAATA